MELDGRPASNAPGELLPIGGAAAASPAVSITVGSHPRILCSAASLTHMSSVACLHQQLHLCVSFASWIPALRQSAAHFPWELEFLVGARVSVGEAAEEHFLACTKRLVGDTAWRYFMVRASALGDMRGSEAYGGCTVAFSDIVLGGQKAYMTSAVLEASLVEIRPHSALRLMSAYALLSGQSASFTTCHKKRVEEHDALGDIKEINDVMPPARYERFLMLLNLAGHHSIYEEVLPQGTIHVFDSSEGGFKEEKDFAVGRVKLFAHETWRLRRLGNR